MLPKWLPLDSMGTRIPLEVYWGKGVFAPFPQGHCSWWQQICLALHPLLSRHKSHGGPCWAALLQSPSKVLITLFPTQFRPLPPQKVASLSSSATYHCQLLCSVCTALRPMALRFYCTFTIPSASDMKAFRCVSLSLCSAKGSLCKVAGEL